MHVAVFGGTGGTGRALIATALAHGWAVRAFVRTQAHADTALPIGLRSSVTRRDLAEFVFRAAAHDRFLGQKVYVHG